MCIKPPQHSLHSPKPDALLIESFHSFVLVASHTTFQIDSHLDMAAQQPTKEEQYLEAFAAIVDPNTYRMIEDGQTRPRSRRRASRHAAQVQEDIGLEDVRKIASNPVDLREVLLVENIDLDWIGLLGSAYEIDPTFFAAHAFMVRGTDPWQAVFGEEGQFHRKPTFNVMNEQWPNESRNERPYGSWHVDGVMSFVEDHTESYSSTFGLSDPNCIKRMWRRGQAATRISFCILRRCNTCKACKASPGGRC